MPHLIVQKLSSQSQVQDLTAASSLLLVSSGVVRKCEPKGTMTRISRWIAKCGLSVKPRADCKDVNR